MSINLIKQVSDLFGSDFVAKAAGSLGESESSVQKGLGAIIPSVFGSLMNSGSNGNAGFGDILGKVTGGSGFDMSSILGSLMGGGDNTSMISKAGPILTSLFGDKIGGLTAGLSNFSGMKGSSITALLASVVPVIMGFFKKFTTENNYTSDAQIQGFLNTQKEHVVAATPAGFNVNNLLGFGTAATASKAAPNVEYVEEKKKGGAGWLLWLVLLAAAALLVWYLMKGCNNNDNAGTTTIVNTDSINKSIAGVKQDAKDATTKLVGTMDSLGNWIADWGADKTIKLADGTELKVGENATEYRLYNFLTNADWKIDTVNKNANWISLDRVYFETGKSVLTAASHEQVKNIALILKNYPAAKIKVGGYTDNTGNADINKKVSDERAKMVAKELVKLGAGQNQIEEAVGYGPEFPICVANDTKECQAQNRRVDLKVSAK